MSEYQSNLEISEAAAMIMDAGRVLVTTHAKPDGDAMGSVIALSMALRELGKTIDACVPPPILNIFDNFRGRETVQAFNPGTKLPEPDIVVLLDTGAWTQLEPMGEYLRTYVDRMLIVDHHLSGDVEAAHRYIDGSAAACAEMVARLINQLAMSEGASGGRLFSITVCDALYLGIASDTGWFRYSNTSPETLRLAARMLEKGVDHSRIFRVLEQTERPEKLALITRALDGITLLADGRLALMVLRRNDFDQSGAMIEEIERLIDIPQVISTVRVVALVTEPPAKAGEILPIRISFRSKPDSPTLNVADLARRFGGGGHARAAGAKVHAPLDEVVRRVTEEMTADMSLLS